MKSEFLHTGDLRRSPYHGELCGKEWFEHNKQYYPHKVGLTVVEYDPSNSPWDKMLLFGCLIAIAVLIAFVLIKTGLDCLISPCLP